MKNTKHFFTLCCLFFFYSMYNISFASNTAVELEELNDETNDYTEIVGLEDEIIDWINALSQASQGKDLFEDFCIDFNKATKIYVDTDIFSLKTSEKNSIMNELQGNKTYMWLLIVNIDNDTYQVHISKGLPFDEEIAYLLTDEEIREIKENEGTWTIAGVEKIENTTIDYEQIINDELDAINYDKENIEISIIGGLEHINQPAALVMNHDVVDLLIPLYDLKIEGSEKEIEKIKPKMAEKDNKVYSYNKIRDAVNNMDSIDDAATGNDSYIVLTSNSSNIVCLIIFISIIICTMFIIFCIKKIINKIQ